MEYTVRWVTQVEAESPEEAAQVAADMQRDPTTLAIVFEVVPDDLSDDPNVEWTTVEVPWPVQEVCKACGWEGGSVVPKGSGDAMCPHCGEEWVAR